VNGPLALSLSSSVTEVGALAAFAALFGIAVLSLLVFSQAREIKRLREWAGRAPERAAEMEQRVSADAAARMRGAPPAPVVGAAGAVSGARVVPRKTPLVSAPVSTAVNATVAAVVPSPVGSPVPGSAPLTPVGEAPATASGAAAPSGEQGSTVAADPATPIPQAAASAPGALADRQAQLDQPPGASVKPGVESPSQALVPSVAASAGAPDQPLVVPRPGSADESDASEQSAGPAPATAAARAAGAAGASARAPLPPSPGKPAPPGIAPSSAALAGAPATSPKPPATSPKPASRPPGPVAAARSVPSRAVGVSGSEAPQGSPPSTRARANMPATSAGARAAARGSGAPVGGSGPKYFKPERSVGRMTALIVGGVIVGVLVLVFAVSALKGGGGSTPPARAHSSSSSETPTTSSHKAQGAVASNPSETAVVVLNGTGTPDLAHHLAADLQQGGYTLAAASTGVPPGTHATTVVQYTHGHRPDAKAVAKALDVTQVQPIESTIASLAGSATVVVLAGADQASQLGGGGAHSNGEPAAGASGEGAAGSGQ
jgi:hypothetical protein